MGRSTGKRRVIPPGKERVGVQRGIYLMKSGRYLAYARDPGRSEHWLSFDSVAEAEKWRARVLLDPSTVRAGKRTVGQVWIDLLAHHSASMRPTTLANWQQEWGKHIGPRFANWPIGKVGVITVKEFLADLENNGVGAATRAKCRSILHRIFEEAVENGEVGSNPFSARGTRVKLPQRKKARILTRDEVHSAINAAHETSGASDALAIEMMFMLGLRIGEMAGLQALDIDRQGHEITIQRTVSDTSGTLRVQPATKSNRYGVLPVPEELPVWGRLIGHLKEQGLIGEAHVFRASGGGVIRPNNWRRRVWKEAMEKANIVAPPTPHSGRRTTASLLSAAGVPPATIQAILRHRTLQQTGEYIDVPRAEMEEGLRRLGHLYAGI